MSGHDTLSGVYAIIHQPSGRAYVGSSCDVFRRWRAHASMLNSGRHSATQLLEAWLMDGPGAFTFVLLESCPRHILQDREQEWLDSFEAPLNTSKNTRCPMFDPAVAARVGAANKVSCKGRLMSVETRKKIADANRGWIVSEATRAKMRGRHNSPVTCAKLSAALQGHSVSGETRAKLRAAKAAMSPEARAAWIARSSATRRGQKNPAVSASNRRRWREGYRIIVHDPDLMRARMSASHLGQSRPQTAATREKIRVAVLQAWRSRKESVGL